MSVVISENLFKYFLILSLLKLCISPNEQSF